ncbi:MAG: sel1 repeat family protein [Sandaracinaceae bacterium]|nr:sel1 repeat family protein [Sandaracinaceae bacterium]
MASLRMTPRYVLCALGLLVTACDLSEMLDHTEDARRLLGERDLTELDVHRATDNDLRYDFVGRREDMLCTGNLEFDEAMSTSAFSTHIACGASIPLADLEPLCEAGNNGEACEIAAQLLRDEETPNLTRMTHFSERACERGRPRACFYVGVALENGDRGLAENHNMAFVNYTRACDANEPAGCFNAGLMRYRGDGSQVEHDVACQFFDRSCNMNFIQGCAEVGQCYRDGEGVTQDFLRARELLERACTAEVAIACTNLGNMYELGQGVEQSDARAFTYYANSCSHDYQRGCRYAAWLQLHARGPIPNRAVGARVMSGFCDRGDAGACLDLGVALHEGYPDLPQDRARAYSYFRTACEGGNAAGCRNVGVYLRGGLGGAPRDMSMARPFFQRACAAGNQQACEDARG